MKIFELTAPESIFFHAEKGDKFILLQKFCQLMAERGIVDDETAFFTIVKEREATMTTGIGYGIAIPHGRYEHVEKLHFFMIRLAEPLDFDSLDGQPVQLVFLLAVPLSQAQKYGRILQALSGFLVRPENRKRLLEAGDEQQIYQILKEIDNDI